MIVYFLYRAVEALIWLLPLNFVFLLGRMAGTMAYCLAFPYRGLVLRNMRMAFAGEKSEAELRGLARSHFATLGANLLSSIKVATLPPEGIARCGDFSDLGRLFSMTTKDRGIVLMISHSG